MKICNWKECKDVKIDVFPYKGKKMAVKGTSIRWLSKHGDDGNGYPEYGLRFFTIEPDGFIPIHSHFYHQTMFILEGEFDCYEYDKETDEISKTERARAGSSIYIPSMEPHGMKNMMDTPSTFLCCICNVYEEDEGI